MSKSNSVSPLRALLTCFGSGIVGMIALFLVPWKMLGQGVWKGLCWMGGGIAHFASLIWGVIEPVFSTIEHFLEIIFEFIFHPIVFYPGIIFGGFLILWACCLCFEMKVKKGMVKGVQQLSSTYKENKLLIGFLLFIYLFFGNFIILFNYLDSNSFKHDAEGYVGTIGWIHDQAVWISKTQPTDNFEKQTHSLIQAIQAKQIEPEPIISVLDPSKHLLKIEHGDLKTAYACLKSNQFSLSLRPFEINGVRVSNPVQPSELKNLCTHVFNNHVVFVLDMNAIQKEAQNSNP